jgi:hypothetical protein
VFRHAPRYGKQNDELIMNLLELWGWLSSHGLEIIAIALSPLIALQVSAKIERARDARNRKLYALQTLLATRHSPFADDRIRTLNMIDVLFPDDSAVRAARAELMKALSETKGVNPDGTVDEALADEWNQRQWGLVSAMAAVLNVAITKADFESGYAPRALSDAVAQQLLATETNKSLVMFARKDLGLPWNPDALFKYPPGVGITGQYQGSGAAPTEGGRSGTSETDEAAKQQNH